MHQALPGIGAQFAAQDATQGAAQCAARARSQGRHRGRIDARRASRRRHWHVPTRLQQARRGQAAGWQCGNSGKACEGGQVCESHRAGPERAARPALARRRSSEVCSYPLRALWQVRSLCVPQGCSRATAAACQLAIAPAMTACDPLQVRAGPQVDFMPEHICQGQAFCGARQVALMKQKVHIGLIRAYGIKGQE